MTRSSSLKFPRSAEIKRVITAVAETGVAVGSVEISPTGVVHIYAAGARPEPAANDFDEWDERGAL